MSYPYALVELDPALRYKIYFNLFLQDNMSARIRVMWERNKIRQVLDSSRTESVVLFRKIVARVEIEKVIYEEGYLHYYNQSLKWKIPLSEENKEVLEQYLENYSFCILC